MFFTESSICIRSMEFRPSRNSSIPSVSRSREIPEVTSQGCVLPVVRNAKGSGSVLLPVIKHLLCRLSLMVPLAWNHSFKLRIWYAKPDLDSCRPLCCSQYGIIYQSPLLAVVFRFKESFFNLEPKKLLMLAPVIASETWNVQPLWILLAAPIFNLKWQAPEKLEEEFELVNLRLMNVGEYVWPRINKPFPHIDTETKEMLRESFAKNEESPELRVKSSIMKAICRELRGTSEYDLFLYHFWVAFENDDMREFRSKVSKHRSSLFGQTSQLPGHDGLERLMDSATLVFLIQKFFGFPGELLPTLMATHLESNGVAVCRWRVPQKTCYQWWNQIFEDSKYNEWSAYKIMKRINRRRGRPPLPRFKSSITKTSIRHMKPDTEEASLFRSLLLNDDKVPSHVRLCIYLISRWITHGAGSHTTDRHLFKCHPSLFTACQLFLRSGAEEFLKPHLQTVFEAMLDPKHEESVGT
eukprot:Protomagalhaensia_wolfi_Nauph_80__741@NODE_1423_length_1538_cov_19_661107_g1100_i0_p1_GENE_NODE_1423_length_1538_cov_19_661107_g1100_i0NODE_1423_length_1538_cov_19_661107_g1100_i0_p1_ORF_typecomplete_len468_score64_83RAP1/PF03085_15/0_03RAP1/PF03085_15/3_5e03_NODE_1423_length_1538_cov_19_661107_g1100_i0681471